MRDIVWGILSGDIVTAVDNITGIITALGIATTTVNIIAIITTLDIAHQWMLLY